MSASFSLVVVSDDCEAAARAFVGARNLTVGK
jgi:hypothetical protein